MAPTEQITVIECPSGVGATFHGLSRSTESLVKAGIIDKLGAVGYTLTSHKPFEPIEGTAGTSTANAVSAHGARDEEAAVEINQKIKASIISATKPYAKSTVADTPFQLVLGGVCCMCPAIISAYQQTLPDRKVGIVWFDADADLGLPNEYPGSSTVLGCMSFTHMTLRDGHLLSMAEFCGKDKETGVSNPRNTVLFGINIAHQAVVPRNHLTWLFDQNYRVFSSTALSQSAAQAKACAQAALDHLTANGCDAIIVHFDVDAVDGLDYPLGNIPNFTGTTFENAMAAMDVFVRDERVRGLNLTEMNPDRDTGLAMTKRLVDKVVKSFEARANRK